jgi:hypothetical protein
LSRPNFLPLVFFVVVTACSTASGEHPTEERSTGVVLPANSELAYKRKTGQDNYFYFDGELALTGIVLAYWQAQYLEAEPTTLEEAEPVREMYLRF